MSTLGLLRRIEDQAQLLADAQARGDFSAIEEAQAALDDLTDRLAEDH
ncbi:hypothetical protein [Mycobacteroides sp. PCS013]